MGRQSLVPINRVVRAAIDRIMACRDGDGIDPLFPAPRNKNAPMSRHLADKWLRKAESFAGLESQEGSLWHAFRRTWATERKHLSDVDVAAVGGWSDVRALEMCYQKADWDTMTEVAINEPGG